MSSATYKSHRSSIQLGVLVLPAALWLIVFFVLPLLVVVVYSFLTPSSLYQAAGPITLNNYTRLTDTTYTSVLLRSLWTALLTTLFCVLLGYPIAYFVARRPAGTRNFFLLLVIIPFWTNFLVRTYSIAFMLNNEGLINSLLFNYLHLIDKPLQMMNTPFAVYTGLVYGYLPFMILPIYACIEKFNFKLIEAAHDLGANDLRAFLRVMVPGTLPGVIGGCILVFIPALGAYVTPDLLGGAKFLMIGNQITGFVNSPTGKPIGSALSVVMMVIVMIAIYIHYRAEE
jgi:spermidine/putrescine transport system permease protein